MAELGEEHPGEVPVGFGVSNSSSSTMGAGFGDAPPELLPQPWWVSKPRACCNTRSLHRCPSHPSRQHSARAPSSPFACFTRIHGAEAK